MRATTAILALAGSALAAPHWNKPQYKEVQNVHVVYETVVHTVYFTEGQQQPAKPTKASTTAYQAPPVTTVVYEAPAPTTPAPAPPAPTSEVVEYSEAPAPAPEPTQEAATSAAPAPAPSSTGSADSVANYMATVDTWRAKMGLKALTKDTKLEANALDTVVSSNGAMVHKLNPGSFGQVLAPGQETPEGFEHVFVGGWLCEIPSLPGLDGICATASEGWAYAGQTGHAELLTSPQYSKIGCAVKFDMWCCDLA